MNVEGLHYPCVKIMLTNLPEKSKIFVASDTNFSMYNKLQGTPFKSIKEMDGQIISRWNNVVGKDDVVFHTGNFGNLTIRERLNGLIYLIPGPQEYLDYNDSGKLIAQFSITKDTKDLYEIPIPFDSFDDPKTVHKQAERYRRLLKESFKFDDVLIFDETHISSYGFKINRGDNRTYLIAANVKVTGKNDNYFSRSHSFYESNDGTSISYITTDIKTNKFHPIDITDTIIGKEL